ncbi:Retrovirus-related Pol polyprotein from transposon gypsy [Smittium culicis]|uniref:Retrovirus-related Pol polyprotein from transposon gypsy n=1 Tax=Smittium culicis TaxID=133412 RepID=A0A1R1XJ29_9FUNG|nr:Retrovirus-related Pol polyprotein from transposon gypsy [Smittium culicis]
MMSKLSSENGIKKTDPTIAPELDPRTENPTARTGEYDTPQQMEPDTGGNLSIRFSKLNLKDDSEIKSIKTPSRIKLKDKLPRKREPIFQSENESTNDSESEFSEVEEKIRVPALPKPGSKLAPYFEGYEIKEFLRQMKYLAIDAKLTTKQLSRVLPKYCSEKIRSFIEGSLVYKMNSWESLRDFLIDSYQEDEISDLEEEDLDEIFQEEWKVENVNSLVSQFKVLASNLVKRKILTEDKCVIKLKEILPEAYLQAGILAQGDRSKKHVFSSIIDSCEFVKKCFKLKQKKSNKSIRKPKNFEDETGRIVNTKNYTKAYQKPYENSKLKPLCFYCDDEYHSRKDCVSMTKDYDEKKIKFDLNGKICYSNGENIPYNYRNGGMKKLVEDKNMSHNINICTYETNEKNKDDLYNCQSSEEMIYESEKEVFATKRVNEDDLSKINKYPRVAENSPSKTVKVSANKENLGYKLGVEMKEFTNDQNLTEALLNTVIPVTVRQLIKSNPEFRKGLNEATRLRKLPIEGPILEKNQVKDVLSLMNSNLKSSNIIKFNGSINNYPVSFTFDTGAMLNLISEKTLNQLKSNGVQYSTTPVEYIIKGLYGGEKASLEIPDCEIKIGDSKSNAHMVVSPSDSFEVLLGMPWIRDVKLSTSITDRGTMLVRINSNIDSSSFNFEVDLENKVNNSRSKLNINTVLKEEFKLTDKIYLPPKEQIKLSMTAYKSVDKKIKPINTQLPEFFKKSPGINWKIRNDIVRKRNIITEEEMQELNINKDYLTKNEISYFKQELIKIKEVFAVNDSQMGLLSNSVEEAIKVQTIPHTPWNHKPIPIPKNMKDKVIKMLKDKINNGILEPGRSAYANRWFVLKKKDSEKLRFIQDVQPANSVTIKDGGLPPITDEFSEEFSGRSIYSVFDLYSGYDQIPLDESCRDLFSLHTPLGLMRMTRLSMGATNSVATFQRIMIKILYKFIPDKLLMFIDDGGIKGPKIKDETLNENGIRRFVAEHIKDVINILNAVKQAGLTVSLKKSKFGNESIDIVGYRCSINGREPLKNNISKVMEWKRPTNLKEVRGFSALSGYYRVFIKDFSILMEPLYKLGRKKVNFEWNADQENAFQIIKTKLNDHPILRSYNPKLKLILTVDSSPIGAGAVLGQNDGENREK